jgi:PAS domain S-box-containing protein
MDRTSPMLDTKPEQNSTRTAGSSSAFSPAPDSCPSKNRILITTLAAFMVSMLLGVAVVVIVENYRLQNRQKTVSDLTSQIADNIHDHLNRSLSATYALAAIIRQNQGHIKNFEPLAVEMLRLYGRINSLQLAPNGVISSIVPLEGNEKAIGHNILEDSKQNKEALLALKTRTLTLAGPFELIQGGRAVVGRLPVYIPDTDGTDRFWGFTSALVRIPEVIKSAALKKLVDTGYHYELSRIHPDSGERDIFARSTVTALRSPIHHSIEVPNGTWTLSVEPVGGWLSPLVIAGEITVALFVSALVALMLHTLYKQPLILQQKVQERTRQLYETNQKLSSEMAERTHAEEALRSSESRYRTLIDNIPMGINLIDREHRIIIVNRTQSVWFGRTPESFVGQRCFEQFEKRGHVCSHCPGVISMQSGQPSQVDTEAIRDDGSRFAASVKTVPFYDGNGSVEGFIEVVEDITVRKQVEDALRNSEARLNESQKVAHIGHYEFDIASKMWTSSKELDVIFGLDSSYVRDAQGWLRIVHPEQREELAEYLSRHIMEKRLPFDKEYRIQRISDQSERWGYGLGELEIDNDGHLIRMFGTIQDITDRKRAEAERLKLEQQMQHAQKLESLGVLAGGIAHDFNNILMSILGHAELAMLRMSPASPARENLASIEQAAQRAADLSRQMLAYSGKGRFVLENIELGELITEMMHILEVSISKKIILRLNLSTGLPPVEVDATQIRQVLMNLMINASEAIGEKSGVIAISTGTMQCDRSYLASAWLDEGLPEGFYIYVEVADTGCGMDSETISKIFDPFFTTKFTGRGLGMAAVLGIVRGHRGAIRIYSEPGQGTTFKILLPAASGHAEKPGTERVEARLWHGYGTILLVDDEETIRNVGEEMLTMLGFDVLTAANGLQAMEIFRERQHEINGVLLDLTMPHMDGEETFRELRRMKPDVRVVISSGYNKQEVSQRFLGKGLAGFIQKPYKLITLSVALKDALDD